MEVGGESERLEAWKAAVAQRLTEMIKDWEDLMDVDDERLYSLGLRHARDVVLGIEVRKDVFVTTEEERRNDV